MQEDLPHMFISHFYCTAGMVTPFQWMFHHTGISLPPGIITLTIERIFLQHFVPMLQGENFEKNKVYLQRVMEIAEQKNCSPNQLALAWVQHKGAVPIPGTTKKANLESNVASLFIKLSDKELEELEAAVPREGIVGDRYYNLGMQSTWLHASTPPLSSWKAANA